MRILLIILSLMSLMFSTFSSASNDWRSCLDAAILAEKMRNIPTGLLQAIALTESGKIIHKMKISWPWTIRVNGIGHYYHTKEQAMRAVFFFQKQGITSIDVGCLQVNMQYHALDFHSLEEMLDPVHNVAYSAVYLIKLKNKHHTWEKAVKFYHSSNKGKQKKYYQQVLYNQRYILNNHMIHFFLNNPHSFIAHSNNDLFLVNTMNMKRVVHSDNHKNYEKLSPPSL